LKKSQKAYIFVCNLFTFIYYNRNGDCVDSRVIASIEIIEHELVPKHEILSDKEKEEILKIFEASLDQLPKILISDPVVKMVEAKLNDVIKITRESPTAGESVYYRVVVEK